MIHLAISVFLIMQHVINCLYLKGNVIAVTVSTDIDRYVRYATFAGTIANLSRLQLKYSSIPEAEAMVSTVYKVILSL